MRSCGSCGASALPAARWCGQCYASLPPTADAVVAEPAPATLSRFAAPVPAAAAAFGSGSTYDGATSATLTSASGPSAIAPSTWGGAASAPSAAAPFAPAPAAVVAPAADGRMHGPRAVLLVVVAIAVGAIGMGLSWALGHDESLEPEAYIRYAIVITLVVYAVVGALIVTQLAPGLRLRWRQGSPAGAVLFGALIGGGLSATLLMIVSAASGHLAPDPRVVLMMSEGDAPHIVVAIAISCVCAPLVEEVLFRGLLLESLRGHGRAVALGVSGAAFAVWHLNPSALRYYALMGVLLGALYIKRGLICSMAAHAAFNGVLTVAALAVVLAPAKQVGIGDATFGMPGGWTTYRVGAEALQLTGPSGATLVVVDRPAAQAPSAATIAARIEAGELTADYPGLDVDTGSTRQVQLAAGPGVEVDVSTGGHAGTLAYLTLPQETVRMWFFSGGSMKAQADFRRMLDSLRVG